MNSVLVISSGIFHPSLLSRLTLLNLIRETPDYSFHFSTTTKDLRLLQNRRFSSLVLCLHQSRISSPSLKAMNLFLMKGGGLLALHSSSTCFSGHPDLWDMIGGRYLYRKVKHTFEIAPGTDKPGLFDHIKPFSVEDTLPVHELQFGVTTHFETRLHNTLIPVVWSKEYGLGKVLYCSLGHKAAVMKRKEVREIIAGGLKWIDPVTGD